MNDITTIDTTDAVATAAPADVAEVVVALPDLFKSTSASLVKALVKAHTLNQAVTDQYELVKTAQDAVHDAMNGVGNFDEASKAFKALNNKIDKMIDQRDVALYAVNQYVSSITAQLDRIVADIDSLEV